MRKTIQFIGIWLIIIGVVRLVAPQQLSNLVALDAVVAWLSIGVAALALFNGSDWFRLCDMRSIYKALGLALIMTAIYGVFSPTFGDLRQNYVSVVDLFVMLESGIVMVLLAFEKTDDALPPLIYVSLIITYLYRRMSARWPQVTVISRRKPMSHS